MDDRLQHVLTLVTCGDRDEGQVIAHQLIEAGLAAGVQMIPIESVYTWEGEVVEDQEWLLIAKTRRDRFDQIRSVVKRCTHMSCRRYS